MTGPYCDEHKEVVATVHRTEGKVDALLQLHGADPNKVLTKNPGHGKVNENYVGLVWRGRNSEKILRKIIAAITVPGLIALFIVGGLRLAGLI